MSSHLQCLGPPGYKGRPSANWAIHPIRVNEVAIIIYICSIIGGFELVVPGLEKVSSTFHLHSSQLSQNWVS